MSNLLAIILWAFAQWGVSPIPVTVVLEDTQLIAYVYHSSDPAVIQEIHYDKTWLSNTTDSDLRSVTLHEVGHVIGLEHYGYCNGPEMAIMGCGFLGYITPYDRVALFHLRPPKYRLSLVQIAAD